MKSVVTLSVLVAGLSAFANTSTPTAPVNGTKTAQVQPTQEQPAPKVEEKAQKPEASAAPVKEENCKSHKVGSEEYKKCMAKKAHH